MAIFFQIVGFLVCCCIIIALATVLSFIAFSKVIDENTFNPDNSIRETPKKQQFTFEDGEAVRNW